jgi:hypothetical protein
MARKFIKLVLLLLKIILKSVNANYLPSKTWCNSLQQSPNVFELAQVEQVPLVFCLPLQVLHLTLDVD